MASVNNYFKPALILNLKYLSENLKERDHWGQLDTLELGE
jgi:hypothetical protein